MSGMSLCPAFRHRLRSLWHQFFGTIALMEFVLKNPCQQLHSFSFAPCQRSYACPMAQGLETLAGLGRAVFRNNRIDEICLLKNPCQQQCIFSVAPCQRSYACPIAQRLQTTWKVLGAQFFATIALMEFVLKTRALPMLFPTASPPSTLSSLPSRSFRTELSPSYFPQFPFRPPCRRFFSTELSPSYFPRFPLRPPCRRFHLAPSERSSPQAICHGFPYVHPVVASISLLPHGALPKLFPTVSLLSTLSSLPSPSFPTELSPSYFPRFPQRPPCRWSSPQAISHGFPSVQPCRFHLVPSPQSSPQAPCSRFRLALLSLPYRSFPTDLSPCYFPRFPVPPPCRRIRIAPSQRSSPQAISHGFPSVHPVVASVSLLPSGALPKLFAMVSPPSTLSSLPSPSFPTELSPSYFPRFPSPSTLPSLP